MGAAGRDFHNFNVYFRTRKEYEVVAFTATQIPGIDDKIYPPILSGKLYPKGIPIFPESKLLFLIEKYGVEQVVFAYSDVPYDHVMHKASEVLAAGADFWILGTHSTTLKTRLPVISICATRTGAGKSQTARKIVKILNGMGKKVVVIRHPMPYGDLANQICQRFTSYGDFESNNCTIEEREEYESYVEAGAVVYAGVDYKKILQKAEREAEIIVWDGGNNDFSFLRPDLHIVVTDALRPGHEFSYFPGEVNVRLADIVIINKASDAPFGAVEKIRESIKQANSNTVVITAKSELVVDAPEQIKGKRVLVIEDGPTLTHGGMEYGAGFMTAKKYHAKQIVSPVPFAVGAIKEVFEKYPHIKSVLPAIGYSRQQVKDLEQTINSMDIDLVIIGNPVDMASLIKIKVPTVRVRYKLESLGHPSLKEEIRSFIRSIGPKK